MSSYHPMLLAELLDSLEAVNYRFTSVTPLTHQRVNDRPENAWSKNLQDIFGWNRPFHSSDMAPELLHLMKKAELLRQVSDGWRSTVRVSSIGEQLFMHSSFPTTQADAVFFGPDTYRFANAIQCHLTLHPEPVRRAIDIGTGSGAGAILLALALPEAEIIGTDINSHALALATANGMHARVDNIRWQKSNLLYDVDGEFDLIIANPPYLVDASERAYRHGGGTLGAQFSLDIVNSAIQRLASGGKLLLYTGVAIVSGTDPFISKAAPLLHQAGMDFHYIEMDPDIFGEELAAAPYDQADRIAAVVLTATKPTLKAE